MKENEHVFTIGIEGEFQVIAFSGKEAVASVAHHRLRLRDHAEDSPAKRG